jgi:Uma2 family endonuclease
MTTTTALSLKAFLRIPEQKPPLELNPDGTITQKMSPNEPHAQLAVYLGHLLLNYVEQHLVGQGRVYVELRTNLGGASRLPDVAFYRRRPALNSQKQALDPADVAVEILSPGQAEEEQQAKCQWYVSQGSTFALLIDPELRTVQVFPGGAVCSGSRTLPLEAVLPGAALTPDLIFGVLD